MWPARRTGSSARSATTSFAGYKSEAGIAQELLDQFPIAERAIEALGFRLLVDARARGRRRAGDGALRDGRRRRGRPDRDLLGRQGPRGVRTGPPDRAARSAPPDHLRRARGDGQVGRARPSRSRTCSPWSGTRRTAIPASPAGARRPRPKSCGATATSRRSRGASRSGTSTSAARRLWRSGWPRPSRRSRSTSTLRRCG